MAMDTRDIAALAAVLTLNANASLRPLEIAGDTLKLKRLAARALSRSVRMCNDGKERDRNSIMKAVGVVLDRYNVKGVSVGGDPRGGSCLTIQFADGSANNWERNGWAL